MGVLDKLKGDGTRKGGGGWNLLTYTLHTFDTTRQVNTVEAFLPDLSHGG